MSIHFGGRKVEEMCWAGRKVKEAWYEGKKIYSGGPPSWGVDKNYKVGDKVQVIGRAESENGIYECIAEHTSSVYDYPWSSRRWKKIRGAGKRITNPKDEYKEKFKGEFKLDVLYKVGDKVQFSDQSADFNGIYECIAEHTSSVYDYPWSSRRWKKILDRDGYPIE